jgi:hypothetical protein
MPPDTHRGTMPANMPRTPAREHTRTWFDRAIALPCTRHTLGGHKVSEPLQDTLSQIQLSEKNIYFYFKCIKVSVW